jgi:hypothetical protein
MFQMSAVAGILSMKLFGSFPRYDMLIVPCIGPDREQPSIVRNLVFALTNIYGIHTC